MPADSTGRASPDSTRSLPSCVASTVARHPSGPATGAHQVAIPSPESRDASTSGAAPCALSAAATTLVAASGPGAAWRPNA